MTSLYPSTIMSSTMERTNARLSTITDSVLLGRERVVSFAGRSQYNAGQGGVSACGLAAMNFARVITSMRNATNLGDRELLDRLCRQETMEVSGEVVFAVGGAPDLGSRNSGDPLYLRFMGWAVAPRGRRHLSNTYLPKNASSSMARVSFSGKRTIRATSSVWHSILFCTAVYLTNSFY
jgi:hypothetical protein